MNTTRLLHSGETYGRRERFGGHHAVAVLHLQSILQLELFGADGVQEAAVQVTEGDRHLLMSRHLLVVVSSGQRTREQQHQQPHDEDREWLKTGRPRYIRPPSTTYDPAGRQARMHHQP